MSWCLYVVNRVNGKNCGEVIGNQQSRASKPLAMPRCEIAAASSDHMAKGVQPGMNRAPSSTINCFSIMINHSTII
jgi:hypothetical protein